MDTFKDKQLLEDMHARDAAPWEVWKANRHPGPERPQVIGFSYPAVDTYDEPVV
jgi:hypothetical protein